MYCTRLETPDSNRLLSLQTSILTALTQETIQKQVLIDIAKTFRFTNFKNKPVVGDESDYELSTIMAYYLGPSYRGHISTIDFINSVSR
jgi:hypothetical protein